MFRDGVVVEFGLRGWLVLFCRGFVGVEEFGGGVCCSGLEFGII